MGKTEEDCVRPGSDVDLRAELSRYPRKMTFLFNVVAIWPVTGQGFQNTKWPVVLYQFGSMPVLEEAKTIVYVTNHNMITMAMVIFKTYKMADKGIPANSHALGVSLTPTG